MDKSALTRATDPSSAPTPGYLYNDISKSLTSPQTCLDTLNFLTSRLSKNNPHIKKKCCKVLGKISAHPASRGMMKRCVVQNPNAIGAIKEAMAYRGTMDALVGDQYNVEVREAAKECLEVVYSDAGDGGSMGGGGMGGGGGMMGGQLQGGGMAGLGSNSSSGGGGMGGFGSSGGGYGGPSSGGGGGGYGAPMGGAPNSGMGGPSGGGGGSRMEGIGNPMFADPRLAQNAAQGSKLGQLGEMASNVGGAMLDMIKDPLAKNVPQPGGGGMGGGGGYNPNARPDPYAQPPPGRNNLAMQTGGQWTMASNRGPNAVGSSSNSVPAPSPPSNHQNSEYYKARNAQGGPAFTWAAGGGVAGPTSPGAPAAAAPAAPSGVGGSWASAPAVSPPQPPRTSVAAQARQPPAANVASAVPITGTPASSYGNRNTFGGTGGAVSGGDYEKNLILELCPPGGMKAEPPPDKLEEFARAVPSLNPDLVCPALLDALEEGNPWIMRAKALCVIETVLKVESQVGGEVMAYADFFYECVGEIAPLAGHARASVKSPAKRVLALLGVDGTTEMNRFASGGGGAASVPAPPVPVEPPTNLLDFDEPATEVAPSPAPVAPAVDSAPAGGAGDSLFSGLNTKSAVAPPAVPPPAAAPPAPAQDDLLGGMGMGASTPASAAPTSTAPAPMSSGSNDLFGNMTVKSAEPKAETVTTNGTMPTESAPAAPTGSAFGFMNATPTSPGVPPTAAPTPTSPSNKTFDPLLSMGMPNGNATNSNGLGNTPISPNPNQMAQMQQMQMAYQQNMMMMQQQMQQMQMAGNFQRQGSAGSAAMPGMPPNMPMMTPPMVAAKQPIMGANYMRQVPGVSGDKMSSFSFLGSDPRKQQDNKSFDFVKDAMKKG